MESIIFPNDHFMIAGKQNKYDENNLEDQKAKGKNLIARIKILKEQVESFGQNKMKSLKIVVGEITTAEADVLGNEIKAYKNAVNSNTSKALLRINIPTK